MSDRMRIETEQPVLLSGVEAGVIVPTGSEMTLLDSTTALLNAGNTYQSAAFIDVSDYRYIVGTIFADQPGTIDLYFSSDGVNADGRKSYTYLASSYPELNKETFAPYIRFRFTNNGGVAQLAFRFYMWGKS